eukprot:352010-Chlamydomonas_euryale.AAC.3
MRCGMPGVTHAKCGGHVVPHDREPARQPHANAKRGTGRMMAARGKQTVAPEALHSRRCCGQRALHPSTPLAGPPARLPAAQGRCWLWARPSVRCPAQSRAPRCRPSPPARLEARTRAAPGRKKERKRDLGRHLRATAVNAAFCATTGDYSATGGERLHVRCVQVWELNGSKVCAGVGRGWCSVACVSPWGGKGGKDSMRGLKRDRPMQRPVHAGIKT